jgi:hypothetical protein
MGSGGSDCLWKWGMRESSGSNGYSMRRRIPLPTAAEVYSIWIVSTASNLRHFLMNFEPQAIGAQSSTLLSQEPVGINK